MGAVGSDNLSLQPDGVRKLDYMLDADIAGKVRKGGAVLTHHPARPDGIDYFGKLRFGLGENHQDGRCDQQREMSHQRGGARR